MKKFLVVSILILALITAGFPVSAASDKAVFTVGIPSELPKNGERFEVSVDISNNPGFCAVQFALRYDAETMACDEIFLEDVLARTVSTTNTNGAAGAIVAAATLDPVENDGKLATCIFTAKTDIEKFDFSIKNIILCDEERNDIEYEIVGASGEADETQADQNETDPNEDNAAELEQPEIEIPEDETAKPSDVGNALENIFPDVKGHWAEEFVSEAVKLGLFKGGTDGNFNPDDNVTRAQFVTTLWRMAGSPDISAEHPFKDIEDQIPEFKSAIVWAYANGYVNGVTEAAFEPNGTLTREAGMKILHYYSGGESGMEMYLQAIYNAAFDDSSQVSEWAKKSVYWGIYNKLISGTSKTTLSPQGTATRAQLAKILVNYLNIYSK